MTLLQKNIFEFMIAAQQRVRTEPSTLTKEEAELRIKLIFEEAFELADALGVNIYFKARPDKAYWQGYPRCDFNDLDIEVYDKEKKQDIVLAADAIADLNYVVNGTACSMGIDMEPIDKEVHSSNMSKFIDGHRADNGKWIKGPSYSPANVKTLIESQWQFPLDLKLL